MNFLNRTSLGALIKKDALGSTAPFFPDSLARATFLFGSKGTRAERADDASDFRLNAERVKALLLRRNASLSDAGQARSLVDMLHGQWLPPMYRLHSAGMQTALTELEMAFDFSHGSTTEVQAVEAACFLRLGSTYASLAPILERFADPHAARLEMARLTPLLASSLASAPLPTKLAALNDRLAGASWTAAIAQAINADS